MFFKTGALKIFAIFTGNHLCWSVFLINLQVWRPAALSKRDPSLNFFPWLLWSFWGWLYLQNTSGGCFWNFRNTFLKVMNNLDGYPANISTSDQCFNVVDQRWNNVDPTLKMKQNLTLDFQSCATLIQRQCSTLKQHWYNVVST